MGLRFPNAFGGRGVLAAGIFVVFANNDPSAVQFLPPLTLTDEEADDIIGRVCQAFA